MESQGINAINMSINLIDQREFRDAMGCFASAVTVVSTTTADGRAVGVTVNSFNSVSLDPPLVLFCLGREASNFDDFLASGQFTVNILRQGQDKIPAVSQPTEATSSRQWTATHPPWAIPWSRMP